MGLSVCLFGKFRVLQDGQPLGGFEALRVRELFSYLLLFHDRPHSREQLVRELWEDEDPSRALKFLRQALWKLQRALPDGEAGRALLLAQPHDVQLHLPPGVGLDVAMFEEAWARSRTGGALDDGSARELEEAVRLYTAELLEGWQQEWCLFERERLRNLYLVVLDRLMAYHEARRDPEAALHCGLEILRHDEAHEQTHRNLMRLYSLLGRRSEALRQYERCAQALKRELDALPDRQTRALYERLRLDEERLASHAPAAPSEDVRAVIALVEQVQAALHRLRASTQFLPLPTQDASRGQEESGPSRDGGETPA